MLPILLSSVLLLTSSSALPSRRSVTDDGQVCKSDACDKTAERILKYMDPEVKPCDDFYQFTCGKYLKSELPKGKRVMSSFSQVQEVVNSQMRELLEEPVKPDEHVAYKAAKKFYALCINDKENAHNVTEANLLRSVGWTAMGGWREDYKDKTEVTARRRQLYHQEIGEAVAKQPWEQCVEIVSESNLDLAISSMYVQRYMTEEKREMVRKMTSHLREQMYSIIQAQNWMNDKTKTKALLKLCRMLEYIGYPDELTDTKMMDKFYTVGDFTLNLDWLSDFKSAKTLVSNWLTTYGYENLKRTDKYYWVRHAKIATSVGAFYSRKGNLLYLTAAFLQPPIYRDARIPMYIYYSTVGLVTGHEIAHGFGKLGFTFDAEGAKRDDWWDESSKNNFSQKSECFFNQYKGYIDRGNEDQEEGSFPYLAGNRSLGEIIADNAGLKMAYHAYQNLSAQLEEPEPLLPNLEQFTREQMFFISMGNLWCFLEDQNQRSSEPSDVHPPSEFRTNGVLQNLPQFSRAFDCKPGSNMNPQDKCSVW